MTSYPPTRFAHAAPFVTIEGVDGAGKSSHLEGIAAVLREAGFFVVETREPGGTPAGEQFRDMLLHQDLTLRTQVMTAFTSRGELLERVIEPSLRDGMAVLCDRFTDSTYAYQGAGDGYPREEIQRLEQMIHPHLQPDLTLLFDLPVEESLRRLAGTGKTADNFEARGPDFFERVREGYHARVAEAPQRFVVIDSSVPLVEVKAQVKAAVEQFCATWAPEPEPRSVRRPKM